MAAQAEREGQRYHLPSALSSPYTYPRSSSGPGPGRERGRGLGTSERWGAGVAETSWEGGAKEAV